jgi:hypothetical protein
MKLKDALEIAQDCGIKTVGEAIWSIQLSALSIFEHGKEGQQEQQRQEMLELINDLVNVHIDKDEKIEDVLKVL